MHTQCVYETHSCNEHTHTHQTNQPLSCKHSQYVCVSLSLSIYIYIYTHPYISLSIYIHIHLHICYMYIYIYIYIQRERERESERETYIDRDMYIIVHHYVNIRRTPSRRNEALNNLRHPLRVLICLNNMFRAPISEERVVFHVRGQI